jgi:hypothetical protein
MKVIFIGIFALSFLFVSFYVYSNSKYNKESLKYFCGVENYSDYMADITNDSFYIHLFSNVESPLSHRNNTVANFVTKLSEKIKLDSQWEVGLAEMSYTKSWFNLRQDYSLDIFSTKGEYYQTDEAVIRKGYYPSIEVLIAEINKKYDIYGKVVFKNEIGRPPSFRYDPILNRIFITNGISPKKDVFYYPYIPDELQLMLGLKNETNKNFISHFYDEQNGRLLSEDKVLLSRNISYDKTSNVNLVEVEAPFPVQFNISELHVLVYCSIVKPIITGNVQTNLLRQVEIPRKIKFGEQCLLRFPKPFYHSIVSHEFETIEIDIKDDSGETIPFDFGRSTVTLHFRKRLKDGYKSVHNLLH